MGADDSLALPKPISKELVISHLCAKSLGQVLIRLIISRGGTVNAEQAKLTASVQRIVVVFDICFSTAILEDLTRSEKLHDWAKLLKDLSDFLEQERQELGFEVYKFIGDGWILFFDPALHQASLVPFLHRLSDAYLKAFKNRVRNKLTTRLEKNGLTFGLEMGTVLSLRLTGQNEYLGRAINLAARLQAAVKQKEHDPQGKVLISRPLYEDLRATIPKSYRVVKVDRELHNVSGGEEYIANKLYLYEPATLVEDEPALSVATSRAPQDGGIFTAFSVGGSNPARRKHVAELLGKLTNEEKTILREAALLGRSPGNPSVGQLKLLEQIEQKTALVKRNMVGYFEVTPEVGAELLELLG